MPVNPWDLRRSDFNLDGFYADPEKRVAYNLFFQYLRLSPSYRMAQLVALKKDVPKELRPKDFELVQEMHARLGGIQKMLFRQWWRLYGIKAFGTPSAVPTVQELSSIPAGSGASGDTIRAALENHLNVVRPSQGNPATLILALPLGIKKIEIMRQVQEFVEKHGTAPMPVEPRLKLHGQRFRRDDILKGLRALWFRAGVPEWEPWRIGAQAGIGHENTRDGDKRLKLNPHGSRFLKGHEEYDPRETMRKVTNRVIERAEMRVENAARGLFPCDDDVKMVKFDYAIMYRQIKATMAWERKERERLLALAAARQR